MQEEIFEVFGELVSDVEIINKIDEKVSVVYQKGNVVFVERSGLLDELVICFLARPLQKRIIFYKKRSLFLFFVLIYKDLRVLFWRLKKNTRKLVVRFF
ncbi:hypothetical protein [Kistimonas scapharcae]|uniref:hypothetical protein n=1 Tax=Kistimonas scapharcae TaxID=1036133 RepID=UPI0031EFD5A4